MEAPGLCPAFFEYLEQENEYCGIWGFWGRDA